VETKTREVGVVETKRARKKEQEGKKWEEEEARRK